MEQTKHISVDKCCNSTQCFICLPWTAAPFFFFPSPEMSRCSLYVSDTIHPSPGGWGEGGLEFSSFLDTDLNTLRHVSKKHYITAGLEVEISSCGQDLSLTRAQIPVDDGRRVSATARSEREVGDHSGIQDHRPLVASILACTADSGYCVNRGKPGRLIAWFHSYYKWNQAISLAGLPPFTQYPESAVHAGLVLVLFGFFQQRVRAAMLERASISLISQ